MSNCFCQRCGASNPGDSLYCRNCGGLLNQPNTYRGGNAKEKGRESRQQRILLDSPDPFPDKVSWLKTVKWVCIGVITLLVFTALPNPDLSSKLICATVFSLVFAFMFHLTIMYLWAGIQSVGVSGQKYTLPYPVNEEQLAQIIIYPLQKMEMNIQINDGITGGIFVWCGSLRYKVNIRNDDGCFQVSSPSRVYYSAYICVINDIPKIAYTIQQCMLLK